jgi:hypothetical protein
MTIEAVRNRHLIGRYLIPPVNVKNYLSVSTSHLSVKTSRLSVFTSRLSAKPSAKGTTTDEKLFADRRETFTDRRKESAERRGIYADRGVKFADRRFFECKQVENRLKQGVFGGNREDSQPKIGSVTSLRDSYVETGVRIRKVTDSQPKTGIGIPFLAKPFPKHGLLTIVGEAGLGNTERSRLHQRKEIG